MKTKKIVTLFVLIAIVACGVVGFSGCTGTLDVNPVDNKEFIKRSQTTVWNEGAKTIYDYEDDNPGASISELTSGTQFARIAYFFLVIDKNKFDGYEFFQVDFDIVADRDVEAQLGVYYGSGAIEQRRHSATFLLKANEKVHQEWSLTKNFVVGRDNISPSIWLQVEGAPESGGKAFTQWTQTQYKISNLKFYAIERS